MLEVNTRNIYSFQNLEIWWQSSFIYFQLGFRKIAKAGIDEPPLMHWTHLFLISSYDFISCSTKASSLSFSVSISCSAMSSDIFSVSRWLKQGSFSWIWKCFNLSTFRRLRNSSKIISSLLIFAGIRTVQNDHLWLISPNWIKAGSLQRTLVLQLICECHSPAQRFVLVPIFVKISLWWCRFFCPG